MRPAYAAILFLLIGLALLAFARYQTGQPDKATAIARKVRTRTGGIFLLVALGLLFLDLATRSAAV